MNLTSLLFTSFRVDCTKYTGLDTGESGSALDKTDLKALPRLDEPPKNCSKSDLISGQKSHDSSKQTD